MLETLRKYIGNSDAALGLGVIFVLTLIIIPLPGAFLDGLIAVSLLAGILILLTFVKQPGGFHGIPDLALDYDGFPTGR